MGQNMGQELQESWGISPITGMGPLGSRVPLPRKLLASSLFGVFLASTLSFFIDEVAHAELAKPSANAAYIGFKSAAPAESVKPASRLSLRSQELFLEAELSGDYRHRIPAWNKPERKTMALAVTATAYNNVPEQTDDTPDIAAWGDRIKPGMSLIAVSRDLLKMGLKRGTMVRISGLDGEFAVLDKMNKRYKKRVDIFMGKNIKAARNFGKQRVTITWATNTPEEKSLNIASN